VAAHYKSGEGRHNRGNEKVKMCTQESSQESPERQQEAGEIKLMIEIPVGPPKD
jgi:hypothetical protein